MNENAERALLEKMRLVRAAALDQSPVRGLTHNFYRYPARFSPQFVRAVIEQFSSHGDVVLDPFMGGGTTIVEGMALGRQMVGTDINSLSVFVTVAKTTFLSNRESTAIKKWATAIVPELRCTGRESTASSTNSRIPRNMNLSRARWLRKLIDQALTTADNALPTGNSKRFARCVLLNVGQWSLNGRKHPVTTGQLRAKIARRALDMLAAHDSLADTIACGGQLVSKPTLRLMDAESVDVRGITDSTGPVDLVVTSPPYPGVHMLYHRWQVDGRKETDAPYWITGTRDGQGSSFYNFADRRRSAERQYYERALRAFGAIRQVMRSGAMLAQLVAFSDPERQLPRYIRMLRSAGFSEARNLGRRRVWRPVPSRNWHASGKGDIPSSREVFLLHFAD